jgi:hypothetical protein
MEDKKKYKNFIMNNYKNNFKSWFMNSKVTDDKGNPLVVFHGSPIGKRFNTFNGNIIWFCDNEQISYEQYSSSSSNGVFGKDSKVFDVYLFIETPYIFDAKNKKYDELNHEFEGEVFDDIDELASAVKEDGYFDGMIIYNVDEEQMFGGYGDTAIVNDYAVFGTDQIKSASDNNGNFNLDSNNIYEHYMIKSYQKFLNQKFLNEQNTVMTNLEINKATQRNCYTGSIKSK